MAELDALDPIPAEVTLESGLTIELERLKSRQFFKLLRIVTSSGAIPQLANSGIFSMNPDVDASEFTAQFVTVVLMCVPEAEDQTIEFIRSMAHPTGLRLGRRLNKQDDEHNMALWAEFEAELDNPELGDLITIIEAIVKREAADIQALGKRLASMFKLAQKTGQIPQQTEQEPPSPNPSESTEASSEDSPVRSISSRRSTGGRTATSPNSRSRGSASASRPSKKAASTSAGNATNG